MIMNLMLLIKGNDMYNDMGEYQNIMQEKETNKKNTKSIFIYCEEIWTVVAETLEEVCFRKNIINLGWKIFCYNGL